MPMLTILLFAACTAGPSADTLITDLRVVAVDADHPEVAPGESAQFTALIADPESTGAEVASWSCTALGPPGTACLEASFGWGLSTPAPLLATGSPTDERFTASFTAPPSLAGALSTELPLLPVSIWTLACEPGLCPILGDLDAAVASGAVDEGLSADLSDPDRWMADLPFSGVSLTQRTLWVSANLPELRNDNPTVQVEFPATVGPEELVDVVVSANDPDGDPLQIFPYTTRGGFGLPQIPIASDESSPLALYGPEDPDGNMRIYVTVTDERGGSVSWTGTVAVGP